MGLNWVGQISLFASESDILDFITNNNVIDYFLKFRKSSFKLTNYKVWQLKFEMKIKSKFNIIDLKFHLITVI